VLVQARLAALALEMVLALLALAALEVALGLFAVVVEVVTA
jgi:hypothetical protein